MLGSVPPDVYTARDIAQAAGVPESRVVQLLARGEIRSIATQLPIAGDPELSWFVAHDEAVRAVRALKSGNTVAVAGALGLGRELFSQGVRAERATTVPLIVSTSLHAVAVAAILFVASLGFAVADERTEPLKDPEPMRMVFLVQPGPGGGGGGGGLKMKTPPPKAERKGLEKISSPLPARKLPPPPEPIAKPPEPPPTPLDAKPVMAPIQSKPAEPENKDGLMAKVPETKPSQGPGSGGGVGTGQGTGLGQGDGNGVGEGSGGGFGGGPFRPGSGVEPPRLLREVKANYTDEARRANVEGEVELEIVVRRDGSVGDVKILRGLRNGLNEQAIAAVRQWRFAPGRMKGVPVDVVVEVGVDFKLR